MEKFWKHKENNVKIFNRGISFTWIIVTTTAAPVLLSHGEHYFPYKGQNYTACIFLTDLGYNLAWFQVICFF